jgi:hypothetical protein
VRGYKDSTSYVWEEAKEGLRQEIRGDLEIEDLRYTTALVSGPCKGGAERGAWLHWC